MEAMAGAKKPESQSAFLVCSRAPLLRYPSKRNSAGNSNKRCTAINRSALRAGHVFALSISAELLPPFSIHFFARHLLLKRMGSNVWPFRADQGFLSQSLSSRV